MSVTSECSTTAEVPRGPRDLYDYLRGQHGDEVIVSLTSVERILKQPLPPEAGSPGWWLWDSGRPGHPSADWRAAGYLAELRRDAMSVRFRRTPRARV